VELSKKVEILLEWVHIKKRYLPFKIIRSAVFLQGQTVLQTRNISLVRRSELQIKGVLRRNISITQQTT
jgi:hypothetical protein